METYIINKTHFNNLKSDLFDGIVFHNDYSDNEIKFQIAIKKYTKHIENTLSKLNISWTIIL